jgi:hypothetical protein
VHQDLQQDVILELLSQQEQLMDEEDQLGINPTIGVIIEDCSVLHCPIAHVN